MWAKGKDLDHRSDPLKERSVPEYSFDFAFPGDEFGHKTAVLVGKERMSELVLAAAIPVKGSEGRYMLDKVLDYLVEAGDTEGRIIIKSDQETAVKQLVKGLVETRANLWLKKVLLAAVEATVWWKGPCRQWKGRSE